MGAKRTLAIQITFGPKHTTHLTSFVLLRIFNHDDGGMYQQRIY